MPADLVAFAGNGSKDRPSSLPKLAVPDENGVSLSLFPANRGWLLPSLFALPFIAVPPLLFHFYPIPFWTAGEPEMLGLADALNLAYRLADLKMYSALIMGGHPGVPFYFMSWLALALTGFPIATGDGFFAAVLGRLVEYQTMNIWLAAIAGASGIFVFTHQARKLVPAWVVACGLLLWLSTSPWSLLSFLSPMNETFGMLINALFFLALVRIADDEKFLPRTTILAASVSAFAYLNKLSFINVSLALAFASTVAFLVRGAGMRQIARSSALFSGVCFGIILFVGIFVIGWNEFLALLRFHKNVVLGSGLYGEGDHLVVAGSRVLDAVRLIPVDKVYCMAIAPVSGALLVAGGFLTLAFRRGEQTPAALISIGAGTAAILATLSVLKHYDAHYTAAVSPTLPACMVAGYMLAQAWNLRSRAAWAIVSVAAIALTVWQIPPALADHFNSKIDLNAAALADLKEIEALPLDSGTSMAFTYRAPLAYFGEGFVVYFACVPRLTAEYHRERPRMFSAGAADSPPRKIGAIVIHKAYFPTEESIKAATNLMANGEPLIWREGDKLAELRTVFVLTRGRRPQP